MTTGSLFLAGLFLVHLSGVFSVAAPAQQAARKPATLNHIQQLVDRGQLADAERNLWELVSREPQNAAAINLLGAIRLQQRRYPEAEALFKRSLVLAPDSYPAYRNLGQVQALQGRFEDAKAAYLKAHELQPQDAGVSFELAKLYADSGDFQRSIDTINAIPAGQHASEILPLLAADYFALKQPEKVAALSPAVGREAQRDPSVVNRFAKVLVENGYVDDAAELLKIASQKQKATSAYLLVLARTQEGQGQLDQAAHTLARVTRMEPDSFEAFFQAARLASKQKNFQLESTLLARSLEIQPDDVEALRHQVLARMRSSEPAKAVVVARHLYSLQPEDPDAVYLLGAALANHSEWHDARPVMEKLVSVRDDATSRVMLGMTLMNDGDIEGASQQIERALTMNPAENEAHYYRGVIARQRGDLQAAFKEMQIVVAANPEHVLAQGELGTLAMQLGDLPLARLAFEKAVAVRPDVPENHYQLALAYNRLGLQDQARTQMAEFKKLKTAADAASKSGNGAADGANQKPSYPEHQN
ncbi:MAG: tetratricopeptide repeat protein [Candidatus Acidiferrum sp.]